jgi:3-oxoacyl-[acyl-carrier protein] reductase
MGVDLKGDTAVVTGGAQGLGRAVAKRLLQDGANVSLWDRDAAALQVAAAELGGLGRVHTRQVDVVDERQVGQSVENTLDQFGAISILVNNAGIAGPNCETWKLDLGDWRRVIDINLTGVFICCRAIVPTMLGTNYGRIINISSVAGKEASPSIVAYAASKAGVIGLTKTLARELARTDIRVNCVTPAAIVTAILDGWPKDYVATLLAKIPMGRFGTPEEFASMVAWIASREASFSTGATFDLTGGRSDY